MAATAGTIYARTRSGRSVAIDVYVPDAVATNLTFNTNGLASATSENQHIVTEDMVIEDISLAGTPTAVGASLIKNSGNVAGTALRWANHQSSLNNRPKLSFGLRAGDQIKFLQF